jgi:hypothetical protein
MNVLAFSLYGSAPKYLRGMVENAKLAPVLYDGWQVRVYAADSADCRELEALGCQIVRCGEARGRSGDLWRLAAAWDPAVNRVCFRDADSRLNVREVAAVNAWIFSGRDAYSCADHPHHARTPLLGSAWGVKAGVIAKPADFEAMISAVQEYGADEAYAVRILPPSASIACFASVKVPWPSVPFPRHEPFLGFVGQRVGADGVAEWPEVGRNGTAALCKWWGERHAADDRGALSGCSLRTQADFLGIPLPFPKDAAVLCVGVGTGEWVREVAAMGCETHALDIVPEALARVHDCATPHLSADELPAGSIDLALSHWVAPHMDAEALRAQITGVVKALRPQRIFAMHFNESTGPDPREPLDTVGTLCAGRARFTRSMVESVVNVAGGKVLRYARVQPAGTTPVGSPYNMNLVAVHITGRE